MSGIIAGVRSFSGRQVENGREFYRSRLANKFNWALESRNRIVTSITSKCSQSEIGKHGNSLFQTLRRTINIAGPIFFSALGGLMIKTLPASIHIGVAAAIAIQYCKNDIHNADKLTKVILTICAVATLIILPKATLCTLTITLLLAGLPERGSSSELTIQENTLAPDAATSSTQTAEDENPERNHPAAAASSSE